MTKRILVALLGLVACGGDDGSGGGGGVDALPVPAIVTVTGTASLVGAGGRTPLADVAIAAYREGETASVAMTTSNAMGVYSLVIPTNGAALDGYLKGTQTDKKDNYLYPAKPLTADVASVPVLMLTQGTFDLAALAAQATQDPGMGWVGVQVFTTDNMPVEGVTVSSSPAGTVRYSGSNGLPSKAPTTTGSDGVAYIFNLPAGNVMLSATGGGLAFQSHRVNARADQVTTTLIQP